MKKIKDLTIKRRVLVIQGPNTQLQHQDSIAEYTKQTLEMMYGQLYQYAESVGIECRVWHSNVEGRIVTQIQKAEKLFHGIILNAGSYSSYSLAIRDAVGMIKIPTVEVHTQNTQHYRQQKHGSQYHSVMTTVCVGQVMGFGAHSYTLALEGLRTLL